MSNQGFFNFVLFNSLLVFLPVSVVLLWRRPGLWLHLITFFLGVIIGWFDMRATEVSVSALMLLTLGFYAGFAQPRRAWLWAVLLGMWVPIFAYVGSSLHLTSLTVTELVTSFLALGFSAGGAVAGVLVRRVAAPGEALDLQKPFQ